MPRILQAMAGARHGGAEAFFTRLALALHRAGLEQEVVIRRDRERADTLRAGGLRPHELAFGGPLDLFTPLRLRILARSYRPDLVLTWMNRATIRMPAGPWRHVARLGGYYDLKYYRRCDHLVGNTPDIVRHIVAGGWPADRAHYIPNFVDTGPGTAIDRSTLATPPGAPVLVALGRLHPNKAFDTLIHALALVPDAVLWLAGDGPERQRLEELAAATGTAARVRFLGWRNDAADIIAAADLLVSPSRHEPLGNVILEGWAQHRPVVATRSAGARHLLDDRRTGLLCPVDDAPALAGAIRTVLGDTDLASRLSAAGASACRASFGEGAVVDAWLDLFRRVTAERSCAP